jgi:hypothetical protein
MTANSEQPYSRTLPLDTLTSFSDAEHRDVCKTLHLPRVCGLARCRRTQRCHGAPRRCLDTHGAAVPQEVRTFAQALLVAARYDSVSPGQGMPWLRALFSRETEAFEAWSARNARRWRAGQ